jgi:tRNA threonylcarbamoyladenosine modification (KEOPS) complex  Pcc1 subunit
MDLRRYSSFVDVPTNESHSDLAHDRECEVVPVAASDEVELRSALPSMEPMVRMRKSVTVPLSKT